MITNLTRLEYRVGERVFHIYCDPQSPTAEIKQVASQMVEHMNQVEAEAARVREEAEKGIQEVEVEVVD